MKLTHSCIITTDVERLFDFYEDVLQIKGERYGDDYAEFEMGQVKLAIYSLDSHEKMAPGSAKVASNKCVILEFNVEDVDKEYKRLKKMNIDWVKPPTVQPWGNKSFYFRDSDGNMISFYSQLDKN